MKIFKLLIIVMLLSIVSCDRIVQKPTITAAELSLPQLSYQELSDSLVVTTLAYYIKLDSVQIFKDSVQMLKDSIKKIKSSMTSGEFDAKFRIARIKKYVAICDYNPVQKKFFFGWIKRAVR